ncbi:MAG: UDP-N-acetylmuramoyl-L-alanyl-D-glutamate--2,6-diaminopimelate ligase [Clostridia bacterium]|nr:UDP-N-acetylmuramoyl-L-alanyl-D-glutamate--2,6-diaminopimelate ligase [Clostridia bacterium]
MLLFELAKYAGLTSVNAYDKQIQIRGIKAESDRVLDGDVFFALEGIRADGHSFVSEAVGNGACAFVATKGREKEFLKLGVPVFTADNTRMAYSYALDAYNEFPSKELKIIAVTGTNGKTSVSFILHSILLAIDEKCGLIGTVGCFVGKEKIISKSSDPLANMTTPDPEQLYDLLRKMKRLGSKYVIMEASSHASSLKKLAPLHFFASVFTNLSSEHLDFHGSMEEYFSAKLDVLKASERSVINSDTEYSGRISSALGRRKTAFVSLKNKRSDYFADGISFDGSSSTEFTLYEYGASYKVRTKLTGLFNVENVLHAIACARMLGVDMHTCILSVGRFCGVPGRMQRLLLDEHVPFSVFIDYAHTPDALEKVLLTLRATLKEKGRLITLFGCGGDRDKSKRPVMAAVAEAYSDIVTVTSDNSRSEDRERIIADVISGFSKDFNRYTVITDRKKAIEYSIGLCREGDVLLLAGKGHEKYEIDKIGRHPFDEEKIVGECVRKYKKEDFGE